MANLSQIELQNLRHFILSSSICNTKFTAYSDTSVDPQIKQLFTKAAQDSLNTKETLMTFINN